MKRLYNLKTVIITTVIFTFGLNQSNAQVGIGNVSPQGALDISTLANPNADGLLIPRVALALTTTATVLTPTVSEMVYNTATAGDVTPGFYYWDGSKWVRIVTGAVSNDWTTTGNNATTAATNFVGTTDAIDFVTRTNNTEKTRVTSAGNVGIGTPTPAAKLDVATGVTTTNSVVNATGSINDFLQYNIQNTSVGIQAQSGYSATADNGTATSGFAWLGINNSGFNFPSTYNIGVANDVSYIGSGQDMHIANANNTKSIIFSTGRATPTPFFNERMRITNAGNVAIGTPTPSSKSILDIASTTAGVLFPRVTSVQRTAIAPAATDLGLRVYDTTTNTFWYWNGIVWVQDAVTSNSWGITGNTGTNPATNFVGTTSNVDLSFRTNSTEKVRIGANGSVAINTGAVPSAFEKLQVNHTGAGNDAILVINNDASTAGYGNAVWARNSNVTGTSIVASGGVTTPSILPGIGAGISGSHVDGYGVYASCGNGNPGNAAFNGHAAAGFVLDSDNDVTTNNNSAFAKLAGKDNQDPDGVGGVAAANILYGGYFQSGVTTQSFSYAGIKYNYDAAGGAGTNYKIIGNGAASTIITDKNNKPRVMFCPEAPEVLFEDYGISKLTNGETYIKIDEILAKSLKVDDKHPLKVFVQLEGDCNGVYVTQKSIDGFKVKELNKGNSNVSFSWHIVGTRANSVDENGKVTSEFENLRLPIAPTMLKADKLVQKKTPEIKD